MNMEKVRCGARMGNSKIIVSSMSYPFGKLEFHENSFEVKILFRKAILKYDEIKSIENYSNITNSIKINHSNKKQPQYIFIWGPKKTRQKIINLFKERGIQMR